MERIREIPAFKVNGFVALGIVLAIASLGGWFALTSEHNTQPVVNTGSLYT